MMDLLRNHYIEQIELQLQWIWSMKRYEMLTASS
tara:strand:- start:650 stop:751 length:102 start_codon:yes stop_codon:yes gene_type:complete